MKSDNLNHKGIKMSRFPISVYWFVFGMCCLMSGVHIGLILLFQQYKLASIFQTHLILLYWGIMAILIVRYVQYQIKKNLEGPLHRILDATDAISRGDLSVYMEPTHTPDRLDYLDIIILNINKMVEELGSIETLKTDFVSNVSHEMKTPIAVIKNAAQLLKKENLDTVEQLEYVEMINSAVTRLSGLITNILKLNKLENQSITPNMERYNVCAQLCDCIIQFENRWEKKQIELVVDIEDEAYIAADRELMEIVWNNLLSNAIKFTEDKGCITVHQHSTDSNIVISVSDTGCGMDEESIKHIFDKFYQGDTSHATEGNGLGLSLIHRILTLMKGSIKVDSTPGEGSTFTVILAMDTE
ncbi:MAG: ATP-binding protein [Wujia sp.]